MAKASKKVKINITKPETGQTDVIKYRQGENPNSRKNLEKGKLFSSEHQPPIYRNKVTMLTDLLIEQLQKPQKIVVAGIDAITKKPCRVIIEQPTKEVIIGALAREASKGNVRATELIFDRVQGKLVQPLADETPPDNAVIRLVKMSSGNYEPL